jgi:hypothetical protein
MWPRQWGACTKQGLCHFRIVQLHHLTITNTIAIWLALIIAALLAVDYFLHDLAYTVFLLRKFIELIEWLAVWR